MTDIANWLAATHREVGCRRIGAGEARSALMRRRYDAPIEDVWDAITDPDRIGRWFLKPPAICVPAERSTSRATRAARSCVANRPACSR